MCIYQYVYPYMKTVFNWFNPTRAHSKSWTVGWFFQQQDGAADDNPLSDYDLIPI